jgi:mono/diheme cytochrome c family protein
MKGHQRRPGRGMPFRNSIGSKNRGGGVKATVRALLMLIVALSVIGGIVAYSIVSRGLSAHEEPSRAEEILARAMRRWATPDAMRSRANPLQPTEDVQSKALEHFADHCATCHANDGSGDTAIGRGLYPRVPDMRAAQTQSLTDGELFSIIEHGIRLTGMPGWGNGTPESERESWGLVHFIRRLPKLTPEEIERMDTLNPKTATQWREEEEARRFLQGDPKQSPADAGKKGHRD